MTANTLKAKTQIISDKYVLVDDSINRFHRDSRTVTNGLTDTPISEDGKLLLARRLESLIVEAEGLLQKAKNMQESLME